MLWRQYRPLPASDVSEFMCSFTDEVLNVRVKFPLQGTSDCCDPYSAVLCQFNLASLPKFYSFSLCHLDYICYICILNIYWAFCERLGFVSLRSFNDCKGTKSQWNVNTKSSLKLIYWHSFAFIVDFILIYKHLLTYITMDGKITSIDKAVSERMKLFMSHYGYTQCDRPLHRLRDETDWRCRAQDYWLRQQRQGVAS